MNGLQHSNNIVSTSADSEGISVMVAGLRSLEKTTVAFVRLADSQVLPNVIEVPLPVRYQFQPDLGSVAD